MVKIWTRHDMLPHHIADSEHLENVEWELIIRGDNADEEDASYLAYIYWVLNDHLKADKVLDLYGKPFHIISRKKVE